jgi:Zn-dependent peptidase ImmA (M78 family)
MDSGVSGVIQKKAGRDAAIYLNDKDHPNRQRFTCAHELGHYVNHTNNGVLDYEFVDYRDQLAAEGTDPEEVYANRFAAALLMPAGEVRTLKRGGYDLVQLAYRFRVSEEAMTIRLASLDLG